MPANVCPQCVLWQNTKSRMCSVPYKIVIVLLPVMFVPQYTKCYTGSSDLLWTHIILLCLSRLQVEEEAVVKQCLQNLSLRSLSKEPSVSSSQMIFCCRRLVDLSSPLMQGLHICISHFYSVMQDGDLCVPWDWKSWTSCRILRKSEEERHIFRSSVLFRQ